MLNDIPAVLKPLFTLMFSCHCNVLAVAKALCVGNATINSVAIIAQNKNLVNILLIEFIVSPYLDFNLKIVLLLKTIKI